MCDGCWVGQDGCGGNTKAYARAPANGVPHGQGSEPTGTAEEKAISKADARISVAWCAEQMKGASECSKEYIGVSKDNGHCWCAKAGGDCDSNANIQNLNDIVNGGFFRCKLEAHSLAPLLMHLCTDLFVDPVAAHNGCQSNGEQTESLTRDYIHVHS